MGSSLKASKELRKIRSNQPKVSLEEAREQAEKVINSRLLADVARCLGRDCNEKDGCLRYLGRKDDHIRLSFISRGLFVDGKCMDKIEKF